MNQAIVITWPARPALPPPGQPVLVRVPLTLPRPAARPALRAILRALLAAWSGLPAKALPLRETATGPVWPGLLHGHSLDLSLTYAGGDGWIALRRGGAVGVDAVVPEPFAEMPAVARLCLAPEVARRLATAADPARQFALAWTSLEARLKCLKRPLTEWPPAPPVPPVEVIHPPVANGPIIALALAD